MTTAEVAANVKEFGRAFVQAMDNRESHLAAYRQFAIFVAVAAYVLGLIALAQHLQP